MDSSAPGAGEIAMANSQSARDDIKALTEQVAALTKLVTQNMQAPAPAASAVPVLEVEQEVLSEIYDQVKEQEEIEAAQAVQAEIVASADELAEDLLPLILQPRDWPVFDWIAASTGKTKSQTVQWIVRSFLAGQRVAHREAMGGGGSSSKDIEALTERLR